ncbi:MAG TPA: hypothetical protein DCX25_02075 [Candidatus Pacebacteria bacterium]|nr:MAG: Oxidoreductase FAD/NAD(P)-binding domain protein [Microgenomates group bacterium GW2011_GWB1_45_17]KKU23157.1 MAG: Oxidoreductase FAD/NAD(P)-binding domain protein [Microgenomates group bacterium GW2011_GWA1_46_15]KKU23820.1 MAG: hypothetical protein UX36_C0003G0120 [Microgenomates group bacterium GW2011_GWC1_46_15]HAV15093.1 hypothetical protein [Candidatus Paceibacterota bacterium]HCR11648.1 hypothetical protein [Candidatus Paceibacterota bacterium]
MPPQQYTAKVSDSLEYNQKFYSITFELVEPHTLSFKAGQYILLNVPGTEQKKSYSIVSPPSLDHAVELLVDNTPRGYGTRYLGSLRPGDSVSFLAPVGMFGIESQETEIGQQEKALVFVATGSGISALHSIILDQLQNKHDARKMVLYWGLRYTQDSFWIQEFQELEKTFSNFSLHLVFSQAGDDWTLCRGRVTDCLSVHPMVEYAGYYLCGNGGMIKEVQQLLLARGVKQEHIHHEKFF